MMHPARELSGTKSNKMKGKKIVLGVTGSIAAVETVKLSRELIRHGAEVFPVMSRAAQKIIHPYALEFATGNEPVTEITGKVQHVEFCGEVQDRADLLLIAPSTANTISKIAYGIDDTTVTTFATTAIGSKIPVIIVPAMHISMYNHPIVLENIEKLKKMKIAFIEPKIEEHKAKMPEIEEIVAFVMRTIGKGDLNGKKLLIIAGSTAEDIDDIRTITNRSTGKTGVELALEAYRRGGEVDLWMGRCQVKLPDFISIKHFESFNELMEMTGGINHDIVIIPAAISDYSPNKQEGKIPSGSKELTLKLRSNPKIIQKIRKDTDCFLVGFKAEFGVGMDELQEKAKKRMDEIGLDLMVANDISNTTQEENQVYIIGKDGKSEEVSGKKEKIAESILDRVVSLC
ncbi:MAG: bifunctional phosphopantothenoylcysteine decarboxylase/phosphopantothenate--cysteine ligase CoaBC [Thermoplasmata archaeon]|nr:MAG: bifunctional phosphopantothenoylcysteine decarboxylase/phosphopantothenate--cysteine ligase CoaBC [Thermoplasmata archaeon]